MSDRVTQDFIFGSLATDDLRIEALRRAERGLMHANRIAPVDPEPDQSVELLVSAGTDIDVVEVFAIVTTDGSDPADGGETIPLQRAEVGWNTMTWRYRQEWRGVVLPQPAGTLVRNRIGGCSKSSPYVNSPCRILRSSTTGRTSASVSGAISSIRMARAGRWNRARRCSGGTIELSIS